jgi:predicted nucleic acid-binding Zn ribbon protein
MMKSCPLCSTEMPERYNYCYQCGEYVGDTGSFRQEPPPEEQQTQQRQERIIHYGCLFLIVLWALFGLWFCVHINR